MKKRLKENMGVSFAYLPMVILLIYFTVESLIKNKELPDIFFYFTGAVIILFHFLIPIIAKKDNKYVTGVRYFSNIVYLSYFVLHIYVDFVK